MVLGIKSNEFHDAFPVGRRGSANVLFPFCNGGIGDAKVQELRGLRHGQGKVGPLLAEMFTGGLEMDFRSSMIASAQAN
jgi:hypothetical protein